jgi:hypothetical protein
MVALCTTRFNTKKFYVLLTENICAFCSYLRIETISLQSINRFVVITKMSVYSAVRTDSSNIIQIIFSLQRIKRLYLKLVLEVFSSE